MLEYARVKAKLRLKAVLDPPAAQVMIANRVRIRFRSSMMRTPGSPSAGLMYDTTRGGWEQRF